MTLSKSLLQLWVVANEEAWLCQASNIEPVHFWLAALKLADPDIATALFQAGAGSEVCKEQANLSNDLLAFLEIDAETAKTKRRETRAKLLNGRAPRGVPDGTTPYLHRSESSRRLFEVAAQEAGNRKAEELSATDVVGTLFEMNLVTV